MLRRCRHRSLARWLAPAGGYLNDPYEGETLTVLLDLFGSWSSEAERDQLWVVKRPLLQAVNYTVPGAPGPITVQRGWWFSAHEQWKTMLLPYFDIPLIKTVFANSEVARTWDAALNGLPGLLASVNDVTDGSIVIPDYIGATGIASIAFQPIDRRDVITPYGSFNIFLHDPAVGACWYRNMLAAPRMQGPHGSTEATSVNGTEISPLTTWDSKITTVLAMLGGVSDIVARGLAAVPGGITSGGGGSALDRFYYVLQREYALAFPTVVGAGAPFTTPQAAVPAALSDWPCWQ